MHVYTVIVGGYIFNGQCSESSNIKVRLRIRADSYIAILKPTFAYIALLLKVTII